ncbi:esterase FE4-like isoform X2 [Ptiloglossa arizonensis]|uniref:esterase FE4-like isoform X2 n=1 Tax=Ptiloglossa arizonensis TaxID=3350558 RepID=UPI003F9FEAD5
MICLQTLRRNHHPWIECIELLVKWKRTCSTIHKPIVATNQGQVQGDTVKGVLGLSYIAFHEIPYAAPPIGKLRFKDPEPPAPWVGVRDASTCTRKICVQTRDRPPYNVIGEEDCLYLNVYTNLLDQSKPVMFWIHGGAFVSGTGNFALLQPDYLLAKDVVIVTVNYRLAAFGFLNLGHRAVPGNQGLKDLIAALQWVKENIANFGGDPNNVTLFGQSAGTVLTHALTISPSARGLFHKAILQSGSLMCPWGFGQSRPARGFKLAKLLGITSTDPEEVVELLRKLPDKDIAKVQPFIATKEEAMLYKFPFGMNQDELAENPVLPMQIEQLYPNDVDIPIMSGYCSCEMGFFIDDNEPDTVKNYNKYLLGHINVLGGLRKLGSTELEDLLKTVKDRYFNGQPISRDRIDLYLYFITDVYIGIPFKLYVEDRVKRTSTPSYFYRFSYVGKEKTYADLLVKRLGDGAYHMDELAYLFYSPRCKIENPDPPACGTKDRIIMERLTTMWTNFAKTGYPIDTELFIFLRQRYTFRSKWNNTVKTKLYNNI